MLKKKVNGLLAVPKQINFTAKLRHFNKDVVFCPSFSAMKEKTTDTANVFDFEALPTHARLTVPVTILKGKNPRPLRHITLGALMDEIRTMNIHKLNDSKSMVCEYEAYLKKVELGLEKPKNAYETKKDSLNGFLIGNYSYRMDEKKTKSFFLCI